MTDAHGRKVNKDKGSRESQREQDSLKMRGVSPEVALEAFMKVDPEKVKATEGEGGCGGGEETEDTPAADE